MGLKRALAFIASLALGAARAPPTAIDFSTGSDNVSRLVPLPSNPSVDGNSIVFNEPDGDHVYNFLASRSYTSNLGDCYGGTFEVRFQVDATPEGITIPVGDVNPWPKLVIGSSNSEFAMLECQLNEPGYPSHWEGFETNTEHILEGYLDNAEEYNSQGVWTGVYSDGSTAPASEEQIAEMLSSVSFVFVQFQLNMDTGNNDTTVAYDRIVLSEVRLLDHDGSVQGSTSFGGAYESDTNGWVVLVETPEMAERTDPLQVEHDAENGWIYTSTFEGQGDEIGYYMLPFRPQHLDWLAVEMRTTHESGAAQLNSDDKDIVVFGHGYRVYFSFNTGWAYEDTDAWGTEYADLSGAHYDDDGNYVNEEKWLQVLEDFEYLFVRARFWSGDATTYLDKAELYTPAEWTAVKSTVASGEDIVFTASNVDAIDEVMMYNGPLSPISGDQPCAIDGSTVTCPGGEVEADTLYNLGLLMGLKDHADCCFEATRQKYPVTILAPSCEDGFKNGDEKDVDCGGSCGACGDGSPCDADEGCLSGNCLDGVCLAPTCEDAKANGDETDVDCGGPECNPCDVGQACASDDDCSAMNFCAEAVCVAPSCSDGALNGDEADVDCGGSCEACPSGSACAADADCETNICSQNVCVDASCDDGMQNQDETSPDCGGVCGGCLGDECEDHVSCQSGTCVDMECVEPTCEDGVQNQGEEGVDCGGPCEAVCPVYGCTDASATNYNADANTDDDSCMYKLVVVAGKSGRLVASQGEVVVPTGAFAANTTLVLRKATDRDEELAALGVEGVSSVVAIDFEDSALAPNATITLSLTLAFGEPADEGSAETAETLESAPDANATEAVTATDAPASARRLLESDSPDSSDDAEEACEGHVTAILFTALSHEDAVMAGNSSSNATASIWTTISSFEVVGNVVSFNISKSGYYVAYGEMSNEADYVSVSDEANSAGTIVGVVIAATLALLLAMFMMRNKDGGQTRTKLDENDDIPLVGV